MQAPDPRFVRLCELHRSLGFRRDEDASFRTVYEARCLAVAPDGQTFAVGTKGGAVVAYRRAESAWHRLGGFDCPAPIRGLAFAGSHLIAGYGRGNFAFAPCGPNRLGASTQVAPSKTSPNLRDAAKSGGWLTRFRRIIPLAPPWAPPTRTVGRPVALGLAEGRHVYVLQGGTPRWKVTVYGDAGKWLKNLPGPRARVESDTSRVVDAGWVQGQNGAHLVLLCSSGEVLLARWVDGAFRRDPSYDAQQKVFDASDAPYRALCCGDVGVVAQGERALHLLPASLAGRSPSAWSATARFTSPGGAPIAMMSVFDDERASQQTLTSVGGTPWPRSAAVVRWVTGTSEGVRLHVADREGTRRPQSRTRKAVRIGHPDHVLQLEFEGDARSEPTQHLFVTWRRHVTEAIQVFDLNTVEAEIDRLAPRRMRASLAGELASHPGTAWWLALRWIHDEMQLRARPGWIPVPAGFSPRVLGQLASRDLVVLADHTTRMLLAQWGRAPRGTDARTAPWSEADAAATARQYIVWIRRLLTAAHELGAEVVRDVARASYQGIRAAESTFASGAEVWKHLGAFAGFLRKWVIEGRSYAQKGVGLRALFDANLKVGNDLDALCYQAQLVRARYDIASIGEVAPNYQIWDMASPESLHREEEEHHRLGIALRWNGPSVKAPEVGAISARPTDFDWEKTIPDEHRFVLAALTTGSIEARSSLTDARVDIYDPDRLLPAAGLATEASRLHRMDRMEYLQRYRLGPYPRAVMLVPAQAGGESFWAVFSSKGWMPGERTEARPGPTLHAVRLRPEKDGSGLRLRVLSARSAPVGTEVYSLLATHSTPEMVTVVVGTRGQWTEPGARYPSHRPVFSIDMYGDRHDVRRARFTQGLIGTRSKDLDTRGGLRPGYNPSWAVVKLVLSQEEERECYAVGAHDGTIRFFWTDRGHTNWKLIPWATISVGSSVWQLRQVLPLQYAAGPEEPLTLAYGTADGVIGVVQAHPVRSANGEPRRSAQEPSSRWRHIVHSHEAGSIHGLVDYCDLVRPEARDDTAGKKLGWCRHLMAVSSRGRMAVFRVSAGPDELGPAYTPVEGHHHVRPRGSRIDRFRMVDPRSTEHGARPATTRALVGMAGAHVENLGSIPAAMVAFQDGSLARIELAYPRASARRRTAIHELGAIQLTGDDWWERPRNPATTSLVQCVVPRTTGGRRGGDDEREVLRWLRIVELAGMGHLLRFAIWRELAAEGAEIERLSTALRSPARSDASVTKDLRALQETVARLTDLLRRRSMGVYERQPVDVEAAKMLWGEAARFANGLGHLCLELLREDRPLPGRDRAVVGALEAYVKLNQAVDDLCNRWIGFDKAIEGKILAHSFANIFDWVDIVLLAGQFDGIDDAALDDVRRFLLRFVLRRLSHTEPMVSQEALRTVNLGLRRARYWMHRTRYPETRWAIQAPYRSLMEAVGDVGARNRHHMHRHSPLATEIATFFAWSALVLDKFAVWTVGHVLSESYLTERDANLADRVGQALERETEAEEAHELKDKLRLFEQYFTTGEFVDTLNSVLEKVETDLALLRGEPGQPGELRARHRLTIEFLKEQRCLWLVVDALRKSFQPQRYRASLAGASRVPEEMPKVADSEAAAWLDGSEGVYYFAHSRAYLTYLDALRQALAQILEEGSLGPDLGPVRNAAAEVGGLPSRLERERLSVDTARSRQTEVQLILDEEIDLLADPLVRPLFEPQRSQYRALLRTWQASITHRNSKAAKILGALDSFNRHAYRVVADDLVTTVTDLVTAQTPLLPYHGSRPLRLRLNDAARHRPLHLQLLERTRRLVESTYLVGAMLEAASESTGRRGSESIAPVEVGTLCKEWCEERDLEFEWTPHVLREDGVPELSQVSALPGMWGAWAAVLWELIANLSKYGAGGVGGVEKKRVARFFFTGAGDAKGQVPQEGFSLQIAGNRPFFDAFDPKLRAEKLGPTMEDASCLRTLDGVLNQPDAVLAGIANALLAEVESLAERAYSVADGHSTGMGLPTISMICEASGLQLRLRLGEPGAPGPSSPRAVLRAPLCAEILPLEPTHDR